MSDLRKSHHGLLLVFLFLLVFGCGREQRADRVDFSFDNLQESSLAELVSAYSIVKLETIDKSRINFIRKAVIANERIYVLNHFESRQEILEFSLEGTFEGKIIGAKDQEKLSGISDFDIQPVTGNLVLLNSEQKEVLLFDQARTFLQKHSIAAGAQELSFGITGGKSIAVLHAETSKEAEGPGYEIFIYDENFQLIKSCFPYEEDLNTVFSKRRSLIKHNGEVLYLREGTSDLYSLGTKGSHRIAELEFPKPVLPLNKRYDAFFSGNEDLSQYVFELDYFESNNILFTAFAGTGGEYYGIYDKSTDRSMLFNVTYDPDCFCSIKIDIAGVYEDSFIVQIPRTKINKVLSALDSDRSKCRNSEMFELIEQTRPGENPILLLLEFN